MGEKNTGKFVVSSPLPELMAIQHIPAGISSGESKAGLGPDTHLEALAS